MGFGGMQKGNKRASRALTTALAAFAVLCGLILLVNSPTLSCSAQSPEKTQKEAAAAQLLGALSHLDVADQALTQRNYGQAKEQIKKLKAALMGALKQLQATPERVP
jgi:predicted PurR-regulated permease PerM